MRLLVLHGLWSVPLLLKLADKWTWTITFVVILRNGVSSEMLLPAVLVLKSRGRWRTQRVNILFSRRVDRCDLSWWLVLR